MGKFREYIEVMINRRQDNDPIDRRYRSLRSLLRNADKIAGMGKEYKEAIDRISIMAEEIYPHVARRRRR
ncbi:MAG: hypothetical protein M1562_02175 [Candidatus Marsarchaeota archaeon]|jgi:hypothetical protein|nr:hypothetical protein [Candidatus Marsarchaeota archaeon]